MSIKHIISDWNGTLFCDRDEGKLWSYVGVSALKDALPYPRATANLVSAAFRLNKLTADYKRGEIGYDKIYEFFNERVLVHISPEVVKRYVTAYAAKPETQAKVDDRLLRPIQELCDNSARCDIVSTGYDDGIRSILGKHTNWTFDFGSTANCLEKSGKGSKFGLSIYTAEDKRRVFESCVKSSRAALPEILFIGDSDTDEACMDHAAMMGSRVVAPFFATDAFKQHVAREYNAFVPESERDFSTFLKKA